jgi:hypothetical protein
MSELVFEQIATGRTHQVGGIYEPILGADGKPETEWALCAIIDGHRVPLETYSIGYVEHMVGRPDTAVEQGSQEGSTGTATSELDAANARIAELEAQLAAAQGEQQQPAEQQPPPAAQ